MIFLKHKSTLHEKVSAEECGVNWYIENNLLEETHAIYGGGIPLISLSDGFFGFLLISGLYQVENPLFGVKVLSDLLARKGESL